MLVKQFILALFFPLKVWTYLVEVYHGLPELVLGLVEIAHTDLTEVTRMVLVDIGAVMMLTTSHTTTTWMLAVLANTTVSGRDVAAAVENYGQSMFKIFSLRSRMCSWKGYVSAVQGHSLLAGLGQSGRHVD
jgi:hypothetical protein